MSGVRRIDELAAAGQLQFLADYRLGSVRDLSPSPLALPTVSNSPQWMESPKGSGILFPTGSTACVDYGAAAKCDTTTGGAVWCVVDFIAYPPAPANYGILLRKQNWGAGLNGYSIYMDGSVTLQFALGDGVGLQVASRGVANFIQTVPVFLAMTWNGTRFRCFQDGVRWSDVAQTRVPSPVGQNLRIGNDNAGSGYPFRSAVLVAGISTTALSDSDIARIYTDWVSESTSKNLARRGFVYKYPSKNAAEYAAAGIVLDTDFGSEMNGTTRRIRDLTNNYPGAITNLFIPGNGDGCTVQNSSQLAHGAMAQLSGATKATFVFDAEWDSLIAPGRYLMQITDGAANTINCLCTNGGGGLSYLRVNISRGGVLAYGETTGNVLRGNRRQHIVIVFDGTGATNAERLKLYIDGELVALAFTGNITADLGPGLTSYYGVNPITAAHTIRQYQVRAGVALSAQEVRALYLEWPAKQLRLRETLEDVPVSLVASVGAGGKIGPWDVISGSFKCSETSDGKRWLECVTGGAAACLQPHAFGTWVFTLQRPVPGNNTHISFAMQKRLQWNTATQNGYDIYIKASGTTALDRITNGVEVADMYYAVNVLPGASAYQFCVTRRVSDGRFTFWAKGGAYAEWTLLAPNAPWTNPSGGESAYTDSAWFVATFIAGDKLCLYDPRDPTVGFNVFAGCLSPTMGELPGSTLLNILGMSSQFTQPPWSDSGPATITVTDRVYASPGGTPAHAARLDILAGGSTGFVTQINTVSATAQYTGSVYVRAVVGNSCTVDFWNTVNTYSVAVNLTTGVVTPAATAFGNPYCWTEDAGGGWWRICWSVIAGTATLEMTIHGDNAGDVLAVDEAQLVQGPCAGRYRETT